MDRQAANHPANTAKESPAADAVTSDQDALNRRLQEVTGNVRNAFPKLVQNQKQQGKEVLEEKLRVIQGKCFGLRMGMELKPTDEERGRIEERLTALETEALGAKTDYNAMVNRLDEMSREFDLLLRYEGLEKTMASAQASKDATRRK